MTNSRNTSNNTMTNSNTIITEDHYNNNYYNTEPGVSQPRYMTPEECDAIKDAYLNNISDTMTAAVAHMIEQAFTAGLTSSEIIMAIEDTGMAKFPSPWYLKKILTTWAENGVTVSRIRNLVQSNRAQPWWK